MFPKETASFQPGNKPEIVMRAHPVLYTEVRSPLARFAMVLKQAFLTV